MPVDDAESAYFTGPTIMESFDVTKEITMNLECTDQFKKYALRRTWLEKSLKIYTML